MENEIGELFKSGLILFFLSMFVSFFDSRVGNFLKKIAYLNAFSIIFLILIQIWLLFIKFTDVLEKIGDWKLF